ncbi:hypothetical protein [Massilia sp. TN1-12]|uniref:hypothetical protein n=1 Tax=Massilia paldalensis TaxID=3377675 RepID=UPI00384B2B63
MSRLLAAALVVAALAGCATRSQAPGTLVQQQRFSQLVVPGKTTRAELLAAFGQTRNVVFDSGMEAWVYSTDAGNGRTAELVLLLDRAGVVRKMRTRPSYPTDPAP